MKKTLCRSAVDERGEKDRWLQRGFAAENTSNTAM